MKLISYIAILYMFILQCTEQYSINFPEQSSHYSESDYFVCYTYPDGTTTDSLVQLTSTGVFTARSPGSYMHARTTMLAIGSIASYDVTVCNRASSRAYYNTTS